MKKVLFATTALVASAGIASAQGVALSGSAQMGLQGGSVVSDNIQFITDIDVTFTLSGTTDNGLTFGGSIDLDESDGSGHCTISDNDSTNRAPTINGHPMDLVYTNPLDGYFPGALDERDAGEVNASCSVRGDSLAFGDLKQGGETVFISGAFGTLTMGDTDGAFDWALTEAIIGGALGDDHEHAGYNGNAGLDGTYDGQIARYDYSFGDFAFAASVELDDAGVGDPVWGIGGKYSGDLGGVALGFGLAYQSNGMRDIYGVSVDATVAGGFRAIVNYSELDGMPVSNSGLGVSGRPMDSHMGVAIGYSWDAIEVAANYGVYSGVGGAGDLQGYGVVVNYDLGGGAEVQFGYGYSEDTAAGGSTGDSFSLGVAMSF